MAEAAPHVTNLQVADLFATPVAMASLPDAAAFNARIRPLILNRRRMHPTQTRSAMNGWQSDTEMVQWAGDALQPLLLAVIELCNRRTVDVAEQDRPRFRWVPQAWANVHEQGGANQFHTHPGAVWSLVYYVDDGYAGSGERSLGGEFILLDPRMPAISMTSPDLRCRQADDGISETEILMRPATGRLLMFPSWLTHGVRPYLGTGTRISIAVNVLTLPA